MKEKTQESIQQLQLMEQNLQNLFMQRQQFQTQMLEAESALKEIKATSQAYKIVGNIMISSSKEQLEQELQQKKEVLEIRIKNLQKQEDLIKEKAKRLQQEVVQDMKDHAQKKG